MFIEPSEKVRVGLILLKRAMSGYILKELKKEYGTNGTTWWYKGIEEKLKENHPNDLNNTVEPSDTEHDKLHKLDSNALLNVLTENWDNVFEKLLKSHRLEKDDIQKLKDIRICVAHERDITWRDAYQDIKRLKEFASAIDAFEKDELEKLEGWVYDRHRDQERDRRFLEKKLRGVMNHHITTEKEGEDFHLYDLNDWQVKNDPVATSDPGAYWSYLENVVLLAKKLGKSKPVLKPADYIDELYRAERISGAEGMNKQYMHGLLCAMGVIIHEKAGKLSKCNNPECPGQKHTRSQNLNVDT